MAMATRMAMARYRAGMEMADLEFAYQLQMEEAMAASMQSNLPAEVEIGEEEGEEEDGTIHNLVEAGSGLEERGGEEEEEEEEGDEEGDDDARVVWCLEQQYDIEVRAVKTPEGHVGIGYTLADPVQDGRVLFQKSRYAGQGLSWHVAEYSGLLEAMDVAERLGLRFINVRVSSRVVADQVNGFWKPKLANQWRLLNQVRDAMPNFSIFDIASQPKGSSSVAVTELAQAAISSHLAGDASSSYAGASTSGAIDDVAQQNGASGASTSASSLKSNIRVPNVLRRVLVYLSETSRVYKENCLICLEDKFSPEMATVKKCRHKFCVACMQRHAEVQVQSSLVPIRCPQAGCPEMLEFPEESKQYLTLENFNILTKRLIEARVPEGDRVYCPYANCSTLMDKSGLDLPKQGTSAAASSSAYQKVDCVECRRSFCLECRVPWHWNRTCQDYQNLPPDLRDAEESNLYKLAQNQKWQRCKKCRRMIELAEGCYHMTCRCGYEFCYICGTEWKHKKQQCQCKLWDERNIVRTPLDSDDESDDDDDDMYDFVVDDDEDVEDVHMMVDDFFDYDVDADEFDELDYDDFYDEEDIVPGLDELVHGFEELTGVDRMLDRMMFEPPGPPPFPNRFFKTKLCRYYLRPGGCTEGGLCNFAHGEHELRHI